MTQSVCIRNYRSTDLDALIDIFNGAVRQVASRDYSADQVAAWAPVAVNRERWSERMANRPTYVAEIDGEIVGFSDLEPDGRIDMMFVHAGYQRRGVARSLLDHIEAVARVRRLPFLRTESSITARPAFERFGFSLVEAHDVELSGHLFRNYRMTKAL
jgi:putative acetyltransferase